MENVNDYTAALSLIDKLRIQNQSLVDANAALRSQAVRFSEELYNLRQQIQHVPGESVLLESPTQLERIMLAALPGVSYSAGLLLPDQIAQLAIQIAIAAMRELEKLETLNYPVHQSSTAEEILIAFESLLGQLRTAVYTETNYQVIAQLAAIQSTAQQAIATLEKNHE